VVITVRGEVVAVPGPETEESMKRYVAFLVISIFLLTGCSPVQQTLTLTALPTTTVSTLGIGSTLISEKDGMTLLYVPAGEFTMGGKAEETLAACQKFGLSCLLDWFKNEEPPHKVYLDSFWIDQTEVINAMYAKCVQDGKCVPPSSVKSYTRPSYYGNSQFDNYPMINISWEDAKAYCSWANRRLPTEAEWEKTARGEDARAYPWGNDDPNNDLLNYKHAMQDTTAVGKFPNGASPYGVLDMAGNVWEWVADWYDENYYAGSPTSNPLGPDSGMEKVMRGGAFGSAAFNVRSAFRLVSAPADTYAWVGFRCAMSANP
jgi:eukaryotic-like serine/threonine-protein kinase